MPCAAPARATRWKNTGAVTAWPMTPPERISCACTNWACWRCVSPAKPLSSARRAIWRNGCVRLILSRMPERTRLPSLRNVRHWNSLSANEGERGRVYLGGVARHPPLRDLLRSVSGYRRMRPRQRMRIAKGPMPKDPPVRHFKRGGVPAQALARSASAQGMEKPVGAN